MAAYIKELCVDLMNGRFDELANCECRLDIEIAFKALIKRGEIDFRHVYCLDRYLAGHSLEELELMHPQAKDLIYVLLLKLEQETRYLDEAIIDAGLRKYPKYTRIRTALLNKIIEYGNTL